MMSNSYKKYLLVVFLQQFLFLMLASMKRCFLYGRNGLKIPLTANMREIFNYVQLFCIIKQQQIKKVHFWIVEKNYAMVL